MLQALTPAWTAKVNSADAPWGCRPDSGPEFIATSLKTRAESRRSEAARFVFSEPAFASGTPGPFGLASAENFFSYQVAHPGAPYKAQVVSAFDDVSGAPAIPKYFADRLFHGIGSIPEAEAHAEHHGG